MMCSICRQGETQPGTTTVTLERDALTFVAKDVPAMVCANCGEEYLDSSTTEQVLRMAEEAAASGVQVTDVRYPAPPG
ncbi:MAG TPA: type II toxin-antitoxin system MqsA family antitoxin [Thermoleophilia bacterium]|nr:type II toxin-antitoxin system MqsA family antitoxin [Thermoleophilia bacterium]